MRIGLSVEALSAELTGVGRYCWELTAGLAGHRDVEALSCWRGFDLVARPEVLLDGPYYPGRKWRRRLFRQACRWGWRSKAMRDIDLFHGPNFMLPPWVDRGIVTIHDLSVFRYPETHPAARIAIYEREFEASLKRAAQIITPSLTIRDEVLQFAPLDTAKVTAIPMGINPHFRPVPAEECGPVLIRLGLPTEGYGLTVSALEPRKRIDRLLLAWRELPASLRNRVPLVVAGASGWNNQAIRESLAQGSKEGWLVALDFVADADLPALYSGASLFVYPSLYEGFGLPPVEAMACGVPTLVANVSCLPEVTKGAAMLVDPDDIPAFSSDLRRGLEDFSWREGAMAAGLEVAAGYSWASTVGRTVDLYRGVLAT